MHPPDGPVPTPKGGSRHWRRSRRELLAGAAKLAGGGALAALVVRGVEARRATDAAGAATPGTPPTTPGTPPISATPVGSLSGPEAVKVGINGMVFGPERVEILVGGTVTWTNLGAIPHTATGDHGEFDSGILDLNDHFSHTFTAPGTIHYHCALHPDMRAVVVVS